MTRVGGALYLSGGLLVIGAVIAGGDRVSSPMATLIVASLAAVTGIGLWLVGERVEIPVEFHLVSSALGSIVVGTIVVFGGEDSAGLFGIFYVYVAAFVFYYFPLRWAAVETIVAAASYAVALWIIGFEGALGSWLVASGATLTAGALIGSLGRRQRELADAEHERAAALEAYNAARATLLRIVSHDLRGPLGTISLSAHTMIEQFDNLPTEQLKELLAGQRRQAERLLQLVGDVLDSERLTEGTLKPHWQDVELGPLVEAVARSLSSPGKSIQISGSGTVRADPVFLERCVENLLSNALRHTTDGEPVEVTIVETDRDVTVTVDDRGPGVPDEAKASIFEPFVSHQTTSSSSAGLGLSVTRTLVQTHEGDVEVHDRPGGGARFTITLPSKPPDTSVEDAPPG